MTKKTTSILAITALLSITVLGSFAYSKYQAKKASASTQSSKLHLKAAPLFSQNSLNKSVVTLNDLKGKIVIIDFFATWCPPCVAEIPHFIELQKKYANKVQIIGISVDDSAADVTPFIAEHSISYPIVMSEGKLDKLYGGITSIPTTFVLDKNLNIIEKVMGYRDIEYFETIINKELNK